MEILIGILCVPAGLLALCLIIAVFALIAWLFEHGLLQMWFCGMICLIFGCIASWIVGTTSPTICIVSFIVGAVIGLLLYVYSELQYIKEHAKDNKDNAKETSNESFCYCNRKCCKKNGRG